MARYALNHQWSSPIPMQAGDILENRGTHRILLCTNLLAPSNDNSLTLRPGEKRTLEKDMTVVAKSVLRMSGNLYVISGFGVDNPQPL